MIFAGVTMRAHLATLLDDFRRHGRQIAVVRYQGNRRRVSTYEEIARLAGRFAALLVYRGVVPGDRVLIWGENSAEWIAAFYGCMMRGVLAVPLDALGSEEFAALVATDVAPRLAVGDEALLAKLPEEWPRLSFEDWPSVLLATEAGPIEGLSHETPLQILYTSGTTGDPKGVVLTHGNVLASVGPIEEGAKPYLRYEKWVHPLRFLHTLPLSHVFGQTMGLWVPPIFAAEVHFESRLVAPRLIEIIRREQISVLAAVPRIFGLLKSHLEATEPGLAEQIAASQGIRAWRRWIRFRRIHSAFGFKFWALISGGGALSAPIEQFWNALGFVVIQGYGMTETTALITLNHPFHVAKGSIGKPLPGREVKLGADGEVLVRGPMISTATWSGGALHPRTDDWLATGDLAESQSTGDLRFLGRKSEVIVTSAGLNLHPEDMEAAIEQEPEVAACAVVAMDTPSGPEPCAVLAIRGAEEQAAAAIARANLRLADFQRLRRWVLWPEPDLPRTSTGKIRRRAVAEWLAGVQAAASNPAAAISLAARARSHDWLMTLIVQITGETPAVIGDELRLTEDLQLDSLGRIQLAAALEERMGILSGGELLDKALTLGDLRNLLAAAPVPSSSDLPQELGAPGSDSGTWETHHSAPTSSQPQAVSNPPAHYLYPHWPWLAPFRWKRTAFIEVVLRPLVWLLAHPRVAVASRAVFDQPMLIVANHVTAYDGPLIQYALPSLIRRRLAVAMSGEMLEDFRHFRNPNHGPRYGRFCPFGPFIYFLLTTLFNVFPLPRQREFQRSFAHAGEALDRGFSVLVFPEGTRSAEGDLARFRPGIGLLAKQSGVPVLPIAIRGLGELKAGRRRWFRSGILEIKIGEPIRFSALESEAAITTRLHAEVENLLQRNKNGE
jgi:long-chain acyl-CoA synthetase